jgi:hypothetical protein
MQCNTSLYHFSSAQRWHHKRIIDTINFELRPSASRHCISEVNFTPWPAHMILKLLSRDSTVGIATGWTAGARFPEGLRDFSLLHSAQTGPGAHPASNAYRGLFPRG